MTSGTLVTEYSFYDHYLQFRMSYNYNFYAVSFVLVIFPIKTTHNDHVP